MTTFVTSANSPENEYYVRLTPLYSLSRCATANFSFGLLADNLCVSVLCTRATIFDLAPPLSTHVAVDSPDESARCGQGSMIGRAFATGRPVAPLPRRGTDASEDAMRVLA